MPHGTLEEYNRKRHFGITAEPKGRRAVKRNKGLAFVIQKHGARRLHYDLRLELDGVMKSWAVTRGPSYDPADKRLAVHVEDHPISYNKFEGVIPEKQYGAGPVMIWDRGTWLPEGDPHKDYKKGRLTFEMQGERMHGRWHLVRMQGKDSGKKENWLLIKGSDETALKGKENDEFLEVENSSVVSGLTLEEIRSGAPTQADGGSIPPALEKLQKKYPDVALATLVSAPPSGPDWWHEIKYDGYRLMAFISDGNVVLRTRGGKDWTHKFPQIAQQLAGLKVKNAVLDGEAGVLNDKGQTDFSALQAALSNGKSDRIEAWFFDLLSLNGEDYMARPLSVRKAALKKVIAPKVTDHPSLHYSEHVGSSPNLLQKACQIGLEGIVSKHKGSVYKMQRTRDWVKCKCGNEQEFVIGGFMPAKDEPKAVGALLLGYYDGERLAYAGKVGTGFDQRTAKEIFRRLMPLETAKSPFDISIGKGRRGYVWVKPETLCQVSFWEWTADKHIRHASFKGLREDKAPREIQREKPEMQRKGVKGKYTVEGITITHPDREVFPGTGITKGAIAAYYAEAMPYLLPFAERRLLTLLRCTETVGGECFYQRAPMKGGQRHVKSVNDMHNGNKHTYLYVDSAEGIMELVQMGTIEFHAWQSRVNDLQKPDQMIFDLDPAEDVPFEAVRLAAADIRNRLKAYSLESFPRLTGGKGVHIVVPLKPAEDWDIVKPFARSLAQEMARSTPEAYIANMSKQKRKGRIFIDYLRNDYSATAIVPFSLRARSGAPVAVPVTWRELEKTASPHVFTFSNIKEKMNARTKKVMGDFMDLARTQKI